MKKDIGWDWMTGKTPDMGGQGVLAPEKGSYKRPRGMDGVTYRNQRKTSALEDAGKIAKELGAQDTLHHGGRHVKLDSFGHPVDATAPTGIDWLLANGPNRQSVKDREQAMITPMADKQEAIKRNLGFKQEEIQNRHPFQQIQDNGQGMKMAFGKDGQPVGFSTQGKSSLHVGKNPSVNGETWGPSQQDVKQSINGAVDPWQQGLWQSEAAGKMANEAKGFQATQQPQVQQQAYAPQVQSQPRVSAEPRNMDNPTGFLNAPNPYLHAPAVQAQVPLASQTSPKQTFVPGLEDNWFRNKHNPFAIYDGLVHPGDYKQPEPMISNEQVQQAAMGFLTNPVVRSIANPLEGLKNAGRLLTRPLKGNPAFAGSQMDNYLNR